uniref:LysR family transcriptional regulator n=1 Tax=Thaumasiovibrio occultus TaxID=1891184 RepID=UPI000B353308|nr:LysR family transcriptional regulator [Thaumasiovibrio occultus]
MSLPPLYALRAFESAVRTGSFSKAAAQLNLTPSAVSRHVATLEAWFDCQLFVRRGPKVEVTQRGQLLANQLDVGFRQIEHACLALQQNTKELRLKAPSTLTMRWLLDALNSFRESHSMPEVLISSVWMDKDSVDFANEPYDCAILLGDGNFGAGTESVLLFPEYLIPVCAPEHVGQARVDLNDCELIHPTADRRDWRRWLAATDQVGSLDIARGKVFDTLEQGNIAAISGYGISIGDLLLSLEAIARGVLKLPFSQGVITGDAYYLVWPTATSCKSNIELLHRWLNDRVPADIPDGVTILPASSY